MLKGEATKKPRDWKVFLSNEENKVQLIKLLLKVWSSDQYASKLKGRKFIFICETKAYLITSDDGKTTHKEELKDLTSSQEETDSRVVLYLKYAEQKQYKFVRVKSPDTDVFFILLYYAGSTPGIKVLFDTGSGNHQRLIDVTQLAEHHGSETCEALIGCNAFSGCDSTSAFKGIGKIKPIKTMLRNRRYIQILAQLGKEWNVEDEVTDELESFTCALYGRAHKIHSVNEFRNTRLNELCSQSGILPSKNIDMSGMPPCKQSLIQHIRRVNYQVAVWKRAHIAFPTVPKASESHGWKVEDDIIQPVWYEGNIVPQILADIAGDGEESEEASSDDEDPFLDVEQEFDGYNSEEASSDNDES